MKANGKAHGSGGGSGGSSDSSPSPPPSPRRRASLSFCRRKLKSKPFLGGFRRKLRYLVVLPMLYISGLIMCVGPFSGLVSFSPPPPGSVYRSHETFRRLRDDIRSDNSSAIEVCPTFLFFLTINFFCLFSLFWSESKIIRNGYGNSKGNGNGKFQPLDLPLSLFSDCSFFFFSCSKAAENYSLFEVWTTDFKREN